VTSTFLNMIVVPTVYNRIEHWRERRQRRRASLSPMQEEQLT